MQLANDVASTLPVDGSNSLLHRSAISRRDRSWIRDSYEEQTSEHLFPSSAVWDQVGR